MALKTKRVTNASHKVKRKQSEMNVLKTLVIVCTCYAVCHLVSQVNYVRFNLGYMIDFHAWYYYLGVTGVNLNCCINPFIYAFKYEAFRKGMRNVFNKKGMSTSSSVVPTSTHASGGLNHSHSIQVLHIPLVKTSTT